MRSRLIDVALLLGLAGLALWLRWPALSTEGFHNEDVAGITYNADLLRRGLLPLVDNLELKAPGSFFMSAGVWSLSDRTLVALQHFMCFWSVLAMIGVYVGGRLLYGARSAFVAALLYCVGAPISDSIDINYGAWMIAPYVWSTVFLVAWRKRGAWGWLFAAGFTLALAGLMKRQAAVLFPAFAVGVFLVHWLRVPEGWAPAPTLKKAVPAAGLGLALGFGTLIGYYALQGHGGDFVSHYFFSKGGWRYAAGELSWADRLPRLWDGILGFWEYMAVPTAMGVLAFAFAWRPRRALITWRGAFLGAHLACSFVGAAVGFRFFKGYYLQLLPAAVWIAAHPEGPLLRWFSGVNWAAGRARVTSVVLLVVSLAVLVPAVRQDTRELTSIRKQRAHGRDTEAQYVSRVITGNTDATDTIWVWGRWAWPVYFHADKLAPTPYYKVLGVITSNLTNTWRRPTKQTTFSPHGPWRELIADLQAHDPAFIVVSRNENYQAFTAFKKLLRDDYVRVPHMPLRSFTVYRHKDFVLRKPPKPRARPKPKPKPKPKPRARPKPKPKPVPLPQ